MAEFTLKDKTATIELFPQEVAEIIPDADMRFSLVELKNGEKHFVCGTEIQIREALEENAVLKHTDVS